ncbi:MAG TPA: VOC family protein [Pyrinomonadaceae bacterium]|nr:VOC family protein [Pyrinomonadaceae bacterium]
MPTNIRPGVVIFTGNVERLAKFYEAMTGLPVQVAANDHAVLASETFEVVIHSLPREPQVAEPSVAREDNHLKPFFPVPSLSQAREKASQLGGRLRPQSAEWSARGFRACEAIDPDGNVIQFREDL